MNCFIFQIAHQYHTVHTGLAKPWKILAEFVSDPVINLRAFDTVYVAYGTVTRTGRQES